MKELKSLTQNLSINNYEKNVFENILEKGGNTDDQNFLQTAGPIWTKLGRNVPWEVLFQILHRIKFHLKLWLPWQQN